MPNIFAGGPPTPSGDGKSATANTGISSNSENPDFGSLGVRIDYVWVPTQAFTFKLFEFGSCAVSYFRPRDQDYLGTGKQKFPLTLLEASSVAHQGNATIASGPAHRYESVRQVNPQ